MLCDVRIEMPVSASSLHLQNRVFPEVFDIQDFLSRRKPVKSCLFKYSACKYSGLQPMMNRSRRDRAVEKFSKSSFALLIRDGKVRCLQEARRHAV